MILKDLLKKQANVMDDVIAENQSRHPHPLFPSTVNIQVWRDPHAFNTGDMEDFFMCSWHEPWLPACGTTLTVANATPTLSKLTSFNARVERIGTRVNVSVSGTWTETTIICVRAGSFAADAKAERDAKARFPV